MRCTRECHARRSAGKRETPRTLLVVKKPNSKIFAVFESFVYRIAANWTLSKLARYSDFPKFGQMPVRRVCYVQRRSQRNFFGQKPDLNMQLGCIAQKLMRHSDRMDVPPVFKAMHVSLEYAMGTVRFWVGRYTSETEIDRTVERVTEVVARLIPQLSNVNHAFKVIEIFC